jgi:serine O-acetyltransferase
MAVDELSFRLRTEALETLEDEPELAHLLNQTVLAPGVASFEDAVAASVAYRLCSSQPSATTAAAAASPYTPELARQLFSEALRSKDLKTSSEHGHFMSDSVRADAMAVVERDPACQTLLEVLLFNKGFAALVCHRAARQRWHQTTQNGKRRAMMALYLQSEASAKFGVDIHPAATIGAGVVLDHGTGIVIGETARVGDGCTLLQGVTLGGTGKEAGDRHPKVGRNVFLGAGASVLGNIRIGDNAKVGAGSIVLRPVPDGATAVGSPARVILRKPPPTAAPDIVVPGPVATLIEPDGMSVLSSFTSTTLCLPNSDWSGEHVQYHDGKDQPDSCFCAGWANKDSVAGGDGGSAYRRPSMVTVR